MKNQINLMKYVGIVGALIILMSSCIGQGKRFTKNTQNKPFDAIIVPGFPFKGGEWNALVKIRVYWAAHLYKTGIAKNIIFSGGSVYTPYIESKIMSLYAQELGVPAANIYTEERAEHSSENLYYSYKIAKKKGFNKIALATDPFQNLFLRPFIKKMHLDDLTELPIVFKELKKIDMITPEIDHSTAFVEGFVSLVDRQDKATRNQGTNGDFIKYEIGDSPEEKQKKKEAELKKKKDSKRSKMNDYTLNFLKRL